jgi:hypothetical protein
VLLAECLARCAYARLVINDWVSPSGASYTFRARDGHLFLASWPIERAYRLMNAVASKLPRCPRRYPLSVCELLCDQRRVVTCASGLCASSQETGVEELHETPATLAPAWWCREHALVALASQPVVEAVDCIDDPEESTKDEHRRDSDDCVEG